MFFVFGSNYKPASHSRLYFKPYLCFNPKSCKTYSNKQPFRVLFGPEKNHMRFLVITVPGYSVYYNIKKNFCLVKIHRFFRNDRMKNSVDFLVISHHQQDSYARWRSTMARMASLSCTPTVLSTGSPLSNTISVGMDMTPKRMANSWHSSTLIL